MPIKSEYEPRPRTYELRHHNQFDAVINLTCDKPHLTEFLYQTALRSFPTQWDEIYPYDEEYLAWMIEEDSLKPSLLVDNIDHPRFIAKKRRLYFDSNDAHKDRYHPFETTQIRRLNSLINEVSLAPLIKRIVASPDAHKLATKYGFSKISFVEPLMGLINRNTLQKYMFYKYIDGDTCFSARNPKKNAYNQLLTVDQLQFDEDLNQLFLNSGIQTYDLSSSQCIFTHEQDRNPNVIHLIDIEGFYRL